MNSKERVLAAINCEKPDKLPFDMHFSKASLDKLFLKYNIREYIDVMKALELDIIDIRGIIDGVCRI